MLPFSPSIHICISFSFYSCSLLYDAHYLYNRHVLTITPKSGPAGGKIMLKTVSAPKSSQSKQTREITGEERKHKDPHGTGRENSTDPERPMTSQGYRGKSGRATSQAQAPDCLSHASCIRPTPNFIICERSQTHELLGPDYHVTSVYIRSSSKSRSFPQVCRESKWEENMAQIVNNIL